MPVVMCKIITLPLRRAVHRRVAQCLATAPLLSSAEVPLSYGSLENIEKVLDLWVQLMKNGVKNKIVGFIILFSVI